MKLKIKAVASSPEQVAQTLREIMVLFEHLKDHGVHIDRDSLGPVLYEIADSVGIEEVDYNEETGVYDPNCLAEVLLRELDTFLAGL